MPKSHGANAAAGDTCWLHHLEVLSYGACKIQGLVAHYVRYTWANLLHVNCSKKMSSEDVNGSVLEL